MAAHVKQEALGGDIGAGQPTRFLCLQGKTISWQAILLNVRKQKFVLHMPNVCALLGMLPNPGMQTSTQLEQ